MAILLRWLWKPWQRKTCTTLHGNRAAQISQNTDHQPWLALLIDRRWSMQNYRRNLMRCC